MSRERWLFWMSHFKNNINNNNNNNNRGNSTQLGEWPPTSLSAYSETVIVAEVRWVQSLPLVTLGKLGSLGIPPLREFANVKDLANVHDATANIERVLGAVERYASELPEARGQQWSCSREDAIPIPIPSMGRTVYLPTWMVDFYGFPTENSHKRFLSGKRFVHIPPLGKG